MNPIRFVLSNVSAGAMTYYKYLGCFNFKFRNSDPASDKYAVVCLDSQENPRLTARLLISKASVERLLTRVALGSAYLEF